MFNSYRKEIIIGAVTLVAIVLTVVVAFGLRGQSTSTKNVSTSTTIAVLPSPTLTIVPTFTPIPSPTATEVPIIYANTSTSTATPSAVPTDTPTVMPTPTESPTAVPQTPSTPSKACEKPTNWVEYVVVSGDTLNSLSTRTGKSVYDLQLVNCLQSYTLEVGKTIYLPVFPAEAMPSSTRAPLPQSGPTPTNTRFPTLPNIDAVTPRIGVLGQEMLIFVRGWNFMVDKSGFRVELRGSVNSSTVTVLRLGAVKTSVGFESIVPPDLPLGMYDVYVINPDNQADVMEKAYTNDANYTMPTATPTSTLANVKIIYIQYAPATGTDLANEYLTIQNYGQSAIDLTNWKLSDASNNTFVFPTFTLKSQTVVQVWSKNGTNDTGNVYWGLSQEVWDNQSDTAVLKNVAGLEVSRCTYSGSGQAVTCK